MHVVAMFEIVHSGVPNLDLKHLLRARDITL